MFAMPTNYQRAAEETYLCVIGHYLRGSVMWPKTKTRRERGYLENWQEDISEMTRPGILQVPECGGERGNMERIGWKEQSICGVQMTLTIGGLIMMITL